MVGSLVLIALIFPTSQLHTPVYYFIRNFGWGYTLTTACCHQVSSSQIPAGSCGIYNGVDWFDNRHRA
ncbi:hypothetical protein GH733_007156, partial [Mirounga leonina]